jgi:hypothetical protein
MPVRASFDQVARLATLLTLGIAALLPLWLADIPPLVDYPNHLARDYVLAHWHESPVFPDYYRPEWGFLPNLAMDVVIVPLAMIMPIDLAGKLFLAATLLLTVAAVFTLSYALHGRVELPAYLVFLFLYHRLFLWGNLNFSFGVALAVFAFALWLLMRQRPWIVRFAVFTVLAVTLLLCHLFAFAVYVLCIGSYQIGQTVQGLRAGIARRNGAEFVLILLHVAVPVLLFVAFSPTVDKSEEIELGSLIQKLTPAFHVVNNYHRTLDYVTFFALVSVIGLGLWKKYLTLANAIAWPLLIGGLVQLAIPEILFGSQAADSRLPIALWMLLVAGLRLNQTQQRFAAPILLGLLILATTRLGIVGVEWQRANPVYAEYLTAFEKIEPGARLLSVVPLPKNPSFHHPPVNFIASLAVIGKSTFDPFLFADFGHQPLAFTGPYLTLSKATPGPVVYYDPENRRNGRSLRDWEDPFRDGILRQYDYLLMIHGEIFQAIPVNRLHPVYSGKGFVLYRIHR